MMCGPDKWNHQDDRMGLKVSSWETFEALKLAHAHWEKIRAIGSIKPLGVEQMKDNNDVWAYK